MSSVAVVFSMKLSMMALVVLGTHIITIFTPMESSSSCASIFFICSIKIPQRVTVTKLIDKLIYESQIGRQDGINEEDDSHRGWLSPRILKKKYVLWANPLLCLYNEYFLHVKIVSLGKGESGALILFIFYQILCKPPPKIDPRSRIAGPLDSPGQNNHTYVKANILRFPKWCDTWWLDRWFKR